MKKLLMFLCCVFALNTTVAFADSNCPATSQIELANMQNGLDNEFIYTNAAVRREVLNCVKDNNGKVCKITKGKVYECDKSQGCKNLEVLLGQKNWVRGDGVNIEGKIVMCDTLGEDDWEIKDVNLCDGKEKSWTKIGVYGGKTYYNNVAFISGKPEFCYTEVAKPTVNVREQECKNGGGQWVVKTEMNGVKPKDASFCSCGTGKYWDETAKKCKNNATPKKSQNQIDCENAGGVWHGVANGEAGPEACICKDKSKYYDKSKKQCLPKNNNVDPVVPVEPTPVKPENPQKEKCEKSGEAHWNANLNECICNDENKVWNDSKGVCEYGAAYEACRTAGEIWDGKNCTCRLSGYEWNGTKCEKGNGARLQNISSASAWLTNKWKLFEADKTVWKDKEGKFNTARLASDSIAGVVLGTAGGLITSNIVKKNQVKDGFDDVSCTIGGQYVADWDDEFTVGIR